MALEIIQILLIITILIFAFMTAGLKNILHAALSLGGMSVSIGGLYWTLSAPYVGLFQMLIYGGAVVVLFVSVIIFVESDVSE